MKTLFLLFKCDSHHSPESMDRIGISDNFPDLIRMVKAQAEKEESIITTRDLEQIRTICQTQGYKGAGEFYVESVNIINRLEDGTQLKNDSPAIDEGDSFGACGFYR